MLILCRRARAGRAEFLVLELPVAPTCHWADFAVWSILVLRVVGRLQVRALLT